MKTRGREVLDDDGTHLAFCQSEEVAARIADCLNKVEMVEKAIKGPEMEQPEYEVIVRRGNQGGEFSLNKFGFRSDKNVYGVIDTMLCENGWSDDKITIPKHVIVVEAIPQSTVTTFAEWVRLGQYDIVQMSDVARSMLNKIMATTQYHQCALKLRNTKKNG